MNHRTAQKNKCADCFNNRRFPAAVVKTPPSSHYIAPIPLGRNRIYIQHTAVLHQYCVWGKDSSLNPIRIESISENLGQSSCTRRTTYYYFVPLSQAVFIVINQDVMMTLKHTYHWEFFKLKFIPGITRYYYDKIFFSAYCVRDNFSVFIKSL